jgi:hypothetical protein
MLDRQLRIALFRPAEPLAMHSPFPGMDPYLEPFWGVFTFLCDKRIATSHLIFRPYSMNAAKTGGTSTISTIAKNPTHPLVPTMPSGPIPCSKSRATDSRRSSPVDEPFNRD